MWILILFLATNGQAAAVTTQEFETQSRCETAMEKVLSSGRFRSHGGTVLCVKK